MVLREKLVNEIVAHAQEGAPAEVVGILAGGHSRAEKLFRATNVAENPTERYLMDSREQLRIMREIESRGWDLVGIYHSHPHSPARPSQTDVQLAGYPEAIYIIVSLKDKQKPVVRGFRIEDSKIREEELVVEK